MQTAESTPWFGRNDSEIAIADRYRLLIDAVHDYAIFMLEPGGLVASWNLGAQRIKGYAPDEIVGRHFSVFYTPEDIASDKPARLLETAATDGRVEDEGWRVRKDGSRFWADVVITAIHDESNALLGYAKITRDMTERRRLDELEHSHAVSALVQQARENEQRRIARELHDDLGQRLVALKMALAQHQTELGTALAGPLRHTLTSLTEMASQIDSLTMSVRRIAADLRPSLLDDLGLEAALEWLAHDFERRCGVAVRCELDAHALEPGDFATTALFRVAQEALTNVTRHARALNVAVRLSSDEHRCCLIIRDDGVGFAPGAAVRPDAFGLLGMRERMVQLGGSLSVASRPGAGVTITAELRLPVEPHQVKRRLQR
ncbi:PAS domain-containing sensor histidine kinase [Paraburkholderia sp. J94]|uniref:PAS domain-containing sensor histidine kinase n=1 Tax=Paraburkholderia sp. J94 TaxID=2805441 RepID=UPI002AB2778A|nr:PAS domain-containing sensor histidine kinase [Paraburkholderia sp. J94]